MEKPQVSVILATRNRPELFARALTSVLAQQNCRFEIIVINDGSEDTYIKDYQALLEKHNMLNNSFWLDQRLNGHGQSYALNCGVVAAQGDYVAFLDDDDEWTDNQYLAQAIHILDCHSTMGAVYFDQRAIKKGQPLASPIWLDDGTYDQSLEKMDTAKAISHGRFAHVNTSVIRRSVYLNIGGMDETLRYECDRDLYYRTVDSCTMVGHVKKQVSIHYVPDPALGTAMSTQISTAIKLQYQLRVYDKAIIMATSSHLHALARRERRFVLKHLAISLYQSGNGKAARYYAAEASAGQLALKWRLVRLLMRFGLPLPS